MLLSLCTLAYCQTIVAELALSKKEPEPLWFEYVKEDAGLATLSYMDRRSTRYVGIFKYDAAFQRQWVVQFLQNNLRNSILHFTVLGSRIMVFVGEDQPKEGTQVIYFYAYDLEGNVIADRVRLTEVDRKIDLRQTFKFVRSMNNRLLACVQTFPQRKELAESPIHYYIFEAGIDGYREDKFDLPYRNSKLKLKEVELSNYGNLHLLAKLQEQDNPVLADVKYTLFRYSPARGGLLETPMYFADSLITDLTFQVSANEEVFMGGFYSRTRADQAYGLVYLRLDSADHFMKVVRFQPFGNDFLAKYLTKRQIDKGRELTDFFLDKIILRSDGGMLFLAEQFFITYVESYGAYGLSTFRELYHYNDIAAFSVSPTGELEWTALIPKSQTGESKYELSYFPAIGPSGVLLFYRERLSTGGQHVFYSHVDFEGVVTTPRIFQERMRATDTFYRSACEQITNKEAIMVYMKNRMLTLAKINLD